ncbi:MAG TPA: hypothetical protein VFU59_04415, partial [Candidatus Eisenbacteria bacterium]|nr:hypothetical protein [Candidatus Eisenbacteria bacterium]
MKSVVRLLAVAAVCLLAFAVPASAQYMYIDVDGDGLNTAADVLTPTTTGVDIWLRTNFNGDGSPAVCNTDTQPLTINSYEFFLRSSGGAVTLGTWTSDAALNFNGNFGDFTSGTDAYHGRSGPQLAEGTYKLGRLAISGVAAGAVISIVPDSPVNPPGFTSFGTNCPGNDFDNTYKLAGATGGSDWTDVGNTRTSGPVNANPIITAPATQSAGENTLVSITGSASDPDANTVTLSQTNNAAFLTGPASAGPVLAPSITLTGTPSFTQSGSYTVNWSAADNTTGTAAATTALTITNVNRNPVITAPATVSGSENTAVSVTGSATDPDGSDVGLAQNNNAPFFTPSSTNGPSPNPSITLTGTPNFAQSGSYTINWSANDLAGGTPTATTALTIANTNRNPAITAPATVSGTENTAVSITGSAVDADGQTVTLAQTNNATFLTGPASAGPVANPSITLTGTPNFTQSGAYTINWTANDGAGGSSAASTALTIANLNRNPAITAPATANGPAGVSISVTGSASDPDAQTVTLSQTNNAPFFTASSSNGPVLTPSITLTGTPSGAQTGSFTVNWSA